MKKSLNEKLMKFEIKILKKYKYYLLLDSIKKKFSFYITCLRKIRFLEQYEWICNSSYLLYFQYFILKYEKPSRVKTIDDEDEERKDLIINCASKANDLLKNELFIYIIDLKNLNINLNLILENANKSFIFSNENIFKYLDYNIRFKTNNR